MVLLVGLLFLLPAGHETLPAVLIVLHFHQLFEDLKEPLAFCFQCAVIESQDVSLATVHDVVDQLFGNHAFLEILIIQRNQESFVVCDEAGEVPEGILVLHAIRLGVSHGVFRENAMFCTERQQLVD